MKLRLLDGIGPFFRHVRVEKGKRLNWSKIPFEELPRDGEEFRRVFDEVRRDFRVVCEAARCWGYNAITLDDLNHLADHAWLEPGLREWIGRLRREFEVLFRIAAEYGLDVYITADVFTASEAIREKVGGRPTRIHAFLGELVDRFLADYEEVRGVIFRIGESDGHDVKDALRSELHVRSARMGRKLLRALLPIFEARDRMLVFRTWTVGAYPVGDLLWHTVTLRRLLKGVESSSLILSMKHGDSDFFRYLELNQTIRECGAATIVEFQARREYEGAGEFPAFVGREHARIRDELVGLPNVVGFSVWCQTGGWLPFHRLTFLEPCGVWNEINTAVTAYLLMHPGSTPEDAVRHWLRGSGHSGEGEAVMRLLALSEEVVARLWYVSEYAGQSLFFRRVRIPPLMWVYWDAVFVNHPVKRIFRNLVRDRERALGEAEACVDMLGEMRGLAGVAGFSGEDLRYMEDTGVMLAAARRYFFTKFSEESKRLLKEARREYKRRWPRGSGLRRRYKVKLSLRRFALSGRQLAVVMALTFRKRGKYRILDRLVMLQLLGWGYRVFKRRRGKSIPKFARKRAMGLDTVFR